MYKAISTVLFSILLVHACAQNKTDTIHLYFELNHTELNKNTTKLLDSLLYNDRIVPGVDLNIIGYADFLGTEGHNKTLSVERAKNVADYLTSYHIKNENIKVCIGKGEIERKGAKKPGGFPADRKVDLVIEQKLQPRGTNTQKKLPKNDNNDGLKVGQTFVIKNLYFLPESHRIRPESMPALEKLYNLLTVNPRLKVKIEGHVCCIVDYIDAIDKDNGQSNLSVNRAKAVYDYLVAKGISKDRLRYDGYGKSRPIVPVELNEEDANRNRRVEIRILDK